MGEIAEMALPPQIDVPALIRVERGEGTLKKRARKWPKIKTANILKKVRMIPEKPSRITE
jgi:hypothetical protein